MSASQEERGGAVEAPLDEWVACHHEELSRIAGRLMTAERAGHTLEPHALVSELYLKLSQHGELRVNDERHFIAIAVRAMRQILINHAATRNAKKRCGGWQRQQLDQIAHAFEDRGIDLLELEDLLEELAKIDPRMAQLVELRYFGGLTVDEAAEVLGQPKRTVERSWTTARAWLSSRIGRRSA